MNLQFSQQDQDLLKEIMMSRRDIRGNSFLREEIPVREMQEILQAGLLAPSVGYSQPWHFVWIRDADKRQSLYNAYKRSSQKASQAFSAEKKRQYDALKLEGIQEAPVLLAVYYRRSQQPVLGQHSMPKMGLFSVICAIQNMWLMARAKNIGMGWVSILESQEVDVLLDAPTHFEFVGLLCFGYVREFPAEPMLKTIRWSETKPLQDVLSFDVCVYSTDA